MVYNAKRKILALQDLRQLPLFIAPGFGIRKFYGVFHAKELKLLGFFYRENKKYYGVSPIDLLISSEGLQIKSLECLKEYRRGRKNTNALWEEMVDGCPLLTQKVYTESEAYLGEVIDVLLETKVFYVDSIVLSNNITIDRKRIVRVTLDKVIIRDSNKLRQRITSPKTKLTAPVPQALPSRTDV